MKVEGLYIALLILLISRVVHWFTLNGWPKRRRSLIGLDEHVAGRGEAIDLAT